MAMTQADWQALADAKAKGGTQYLEALAAQSQAIAAEQAQLVGGIPGAPSSTYTAQGAGAVSTATSVGNDAINAVQAQYPDLAWLLSVPEVAPLIIQAANTNMDPNAFKAEFESTNWYKTSSQSVRNWIAETQTDPAQAQSDLQAQESTIFATISTLGVGALPQQVTWLAQQSLAFGWTDQQIKDHISSSIQYDKAGNPFLSINGISAAGGTTPGTLQADASSIQAEAAKYLVPISDTTAQSFSKALANGTMDVSGVDAYLQSQAESLYPSISAAIKSGVTPADYVSPYKEVAAQLLGVSPNSIDMTQAKWNRALSQPGQGGVPQAMSLYDWQQLLMQDPQYQYMNSINAKDRASSIAQGLGEMFGKVASGPAGSTAFSAAGAPRIAGVPIT